MKVELLSYTPDALNLLLTTKGTRLAHTEDPSSWDDAKKAEHLEYMRSTIKSSWEFVDYTFRISGVTRAFTHQLVRTRHGSYAQEAQRVVDVRDHEIIKPESVKQVESELEDHDAWDVAIRIVMDTYSGLLDSGVPRQDARGILPTNMTTQIIAKFNLRTLHEMAKLRMCVRTQGEYQEVFRTMRSLVCQVHPWAEDFINVMCVQDGICAFPMFGKKECPIYDERMDLTQLKADTKVRFWKMGVHDTAPVAKDGKAQ